MASLLSSSLLLLLRWCDDEINDEDALGGEQIPLRLQDKGDHDDDDDDIVEAQHFDAAVPSAWPGWNNA